MPAQGNGLAVVVDAVGLTDEELQTFAAWTNLAETTFLLPPEQPAGDYRVRIFTPKQELPFAGHPTLGSCAAWLHTGGVPKVEGVVRQECGIGLVEIDTSGERLAFVAPPTAIDPLPGEERMSLVQALGLDRHRILDSARLDNGPVFATLHLDSAEEVLAVDSSRVSWPEFSAVGLIGAHPPGAECDYEVRLLAPPTGMSEDPITGSLNAALGFWLRDRGLLTGPVTVAQGTVIGRHGRVHIRLADDDILIGGDTRIVIEGTISL